MFPPYRVLTALPLLTLLWFPGCQPAEKKAEAHPSPAKIAKTQQETALNTIELDELAEKRLGITYAPVELQKIQRVRNYGGEIALPPGASLIISAPVGGKVQSATAGQSLAPGSLVASGQPIFRLLPLLSPEREVLTPAERINIAQTKNLILTTRIEAAGQVDTAKEQVAAAKIAFDRAERLYRDSAGTAKAVDDARSQLNLANTAQRAAEARQKAVDEISLEGGEAGNQSPMVIESPQAGMIRAHNVAPGEVVAAGAPLFEVMKFDPIWVRVPVYAGETAQLALDQPADVTPLSSDRNRPGIPARPVAAPPTATLLAATVDLYYEVANPEGRLRPGERITARIKLPASAEEKTLPWSAVIHDISGGTWVYENTAPHVFVRRRVVVRYVIGDLAILDAGPPPQSKIVTAGALELFGAEFGFAK